MKEYKPPIITECSLMLMELQLQLSCPSAQNADRCD